tara:strand:- start:867 stop:1217 length:351 start_codon:yes stop_codon:yes gene_type:complete
METIKIKSGSNVKLLTEISSEAIVGSYVSLNDNVIKRSQLYSFIVDLGKIDDFDNSVMSSASNFFVSIGDIDPILNNTIVKYTLKFDDEEKSYNGDKVKISNDLFMSYFIVKLIKI